MILLKSSLRYLTQNYLQSFLAILGIALGIAISISIDLSVASSKQAFEISTSRVVGKATHHIYAGNEQPFDQGVYTKLKTQYGIAKLAPVVERYLPVVDKNGEDYRVTRLMGIDALAEKDFRALAQDYELSEDSSIFAKNSILLSKKTTEDLGKKLNEEIQLRVGNKIKTLKISGFLDDSGSYDNILVMDIISAQDFLELGNRLSHIDLIQEKSKSFASNKKLYSENELSKLIPKGLKLERSELRTESVENMTRAFNINLVALSFLALIVAVFLIYNSMSFSVVQRRKVLAVLKALGTSPRQIIKMIFIEALIFAALGISIGIGLGIFMSSFLIQLITQTINDLYFVLEITSFKFSYFALLKAIGLGLATTLVAALVPAFDAASSSPQIAMNRSVYESSSNINFYKIALAGLGLAAIGTALLKLNFAVIFVGFTALGLIIVGLALCSPIITKFFCTIFEKIFKTCFGYIGSLSINSISSQLSRTSVAIASLVIAISVSIALSITIFSFRETVVKWLDNSLQADIYISSPRLVANRNDSPLNQNLRKQILDFSKEKMSGMLTYRHVDIHSNLGKVQLAAIDQNETVEDIMIFKKLIKNGWSIFREQKEDTIYISEPFAYKHKLKTNDIVSLKTNTGDRKFRVIGIFFDYGTDQGIIMMNKYLYRKYWNDFDLSSIALILKDKSMVQGFVQELNDKFNRYKVLINSNIDLKNESMMIFDRTFRVTSVLKIISILVAFIAVLAAFMSLQLERQREFAILRANGVTPFQIMQMLILQTTTMGFIAAIIAIPVGIVQALVMIFVVNQRSFGWTLNFGLEPSFIGEAILYAVIASALAVIYPAIKISSIKPAAILRND